MAALESAIQKTVVNWAREKYRGKLIARKFQAGSYGTNGWPDYEFLVPGGKVFHVEFKAEGGACTPLQLQRHKELREIGHPVYVADNVPAGRRIIEMEMRRALAAA
jgi:hypothetical protein